MSTIPPPPLGNKAITNKNGTLVFSNVSDNDIVNVIYTATNEIICKFRYHHKGDSNRNYFTLTDSKSIKLTHETSKFIQLLYFGYFNPNNGDYYHAREIMSNHKEYLSYAIENSVGSDNIIKVFRESVDKGEDACEIKLYTSDVVYTFQTKDIDPNGNLRAICIGVKLENNTNNRKYESFLFNVSKIYNLDYIASHGCIVKREVIYSKDN